MPMPDVEIEIAISCRPEYRNGGRGHRAQAGPIFGVFEIEAVAEQIVGSFEENVKIVGTVCPVIAGEFGPRGDSYTIAQPGVGDKAVLIHPAAPWCTLLLPDRRSNGIALYRTDRQLDPDGARQSRAFGAGGEHIDVGRQQATADHHTLNLVTRHLDRLDRCIVEELNGSVLRAPCCKRPTETT